MILRVAQDRTASSPLPALLAVALLTVGCFGGKAPPTKVWTLPGAAAQGSGTRLDPSGPALGVSRFSAASELRTLDLTWREGEGRQIRRYPYHEWADYPDRMLRELTLARLSRSGFFSSVTDAPPRRGLDAVLSAQLLQFEEWDLPDRIEARTRLRWRLEGPDGELIAADEVASTKVATAKSVESVVAAFDAAVAEMTAQLADAVQAALAERHSRS